MSTDERRAPGTTRIPFDALVEVGGALGPTFEAQAVNVSEEGIQLRTAYLPEPGQPLTCRFEGPGGTVLAGGEVAWAQAADRGGEFGVRFTEVDPESVEALKRICGIAPGGAGVQPGSKVRLHIDGLASPMRAKIKDARPTAVTVGSDLGFLQVGRQLELEDTQSGSKRAANIERVEVAVDHASNVPQLVVTLRYADAVAAAAAETTGTRAPSNAASPAPATPQGASLPKSPSSPPPDDLIAVEHASLQMKGALARGFEKAGTAFGRFAQQAKTTLEVLAQRRAQRAEESLAQRRTTAPPPGGGLHASGRRVVRGEATAQPADAGGTAAIGLLKSPRRRALLAGGIALAAVGGALALKRVAHDAPPAPSTAALAAASASTAPASPGPLAAAASAGAPATPAMPPAPPLPQTFAESPAAGNAGAAGPGASDDGTEADRSGRHRHARVTPFSNGPVHHGNVLHLKMDGPIESIEGAAQPTGFTVKIPGCKSVEAAAPLASRDARIAAIKVSNGAAGAELTVAFKDGVPNFRVSARGDTLVIALQPPGPIEPTVAKKDERGSQSPKHAKHGHAKGEESL